MNKIQGTLKQHHPRSIFDQECSQLEGVGSRLFYLPVFPQEEKQLLTVLVKTPQQDLGLVAVLLYHEPVLTRIGRFVRDLILFDLNRFFLQGFHVRGKPNELGFINRKPPRQARSSSRRLQQLRQRKGFFQGLLTEDSPRLKNPETNQQYRQRNEQ